jgi:hypothetical protein
MDLFSVQPYPYIPGMHGRDTSKDTALLEKAVTNNIESTAIESILEAAVVGRVGVEYKPLREVPNVVSGDDIKSYLAIIAPLVAALYNDARANLIWEDPWDPYKLSISKLSQATSNDGQSVPNQPDPATAGPNDSNRWNGDTGSAPTMTVNEYADWKNNGTFVDKANPLKIASALRHEAQMSWQEAKMVSSSMMARNIANGPVATEKQLYLDIDDLMHNRVNSAIDRAYNGLMNTADDFREVQALDIDVQKDKDRYVALTGLVPSRSTPSEIPGAQTSSNQWTSTLKYGITAAIVIVVGIAVIKIVPSIFELMSRPSKPLPTPA